ncbi:MAG: hypothetical protein JWL85_68 [Candidatus Saccharibacteria bacterium]|nr:hypothetical protein [Candidatus Saccharibacteria bacterium]
MLREDVDERMLCEPGTNGESLADRLTHEYGPEGSGWKAYPQPVEDEASQIIDQAEFDTATEAFRNAYFGKGYTLDGGTDVRGKVERRAAKPGMLFLVVYPDGDAHYEATRNNS